MPKKTLDSFLKAFANDERFSPVNVEHLVRDTSAEVALKIINQFRITLENSINKIDEHLPGSNQEEIVRTCHKLASSAELVGFMKLGEDCRAVMKGAKTGENVSPTVLKIRSRAEEIVQQLEVNCPDLNSFV